MPYSTPSPPRHFLISTLTQRSLGAPYSIDEVPGDDLDSIFEKICSKRSGSHATVTGISSETASRLKRSVDKDRDPRNSFLLGAAVLWELIPVEIFADSFSDGRLEQGDRRLERGDICLFFSGPLVAESVCS